MEILEKLGINGKIFLAQIVNFFLLMYILKRFLYKPLLDIIKKREEKIKEGLKQADLAEKKIKEVEKKVNLKLEEANKEADKILEKAHREGEDHKNDILREAREEVAKWKEETAVYLKREKEKLLNEVKQETGVLIIKAVEKILDKEASKEDRSRWNKEIQDKIESGKNF